MAVVITPRDRLSFTLFFALSLHAAAILGIGFVWHAQRSSSPTIEVTLAQHQDATAPAKADFIAQADQLGSGDAADVVERTTRNEAEFFDNTYRELSATPPAIEEPLRTDRAPVVSTTGAAESATPTDEPTPDPQPPIPALRQGQALNLSPDIASIEARLDEESANDARGPRIRRLTSVSARRTVDAYYLQAWRRKVESIGNINYPHEARERQLYGSLRMLVSISADGGLKDVQILESSGYPVLDDAAIRIVRLAAPFAPFPPEMRQDTDVLEIIRTWQFRKNRYSSS
jgi:protein TonB